MNHQQTQGRNRRLPLRKSPPLFVSRKLSSAPGESRDATVARSSIAVAQTRSASANLDECIDRAFRIPIFLSVTSTLNAVQQQFLNRMILEIEGALLFPRTLPESEQYPETVLTNIRRLVFSSYGLLAIDFRRFLVQIVKANAGQPPTTSPFWQGSVFAQIEPSMAFQFGLPILLVREKGTDTSNGIWAGGITPLNVFVEWDSDNQTVDDFFATVQWREVFANWSAEVRAYYYARTEPLIQAPT